MSEQTTKNENPATLNLIMLGTGQHLSTSQNVLTQLARQFDINENQSVHLINGVGAKSKDKDNPMTGTYHPSCEYEPTTGIIRVDKSKPKKNKPSALRGLITGAGYRDAMDEALLVIQSMLNEKQPLTINMFGFSRGADTLLRIANILNNLYGKEVVKVNIFAIDPVPGFGRRYAKKARYLPENIDTYESVLMLNEHRPEFEVQDRSVLLPQDPTNTKINNHIFNGNHGSATLFRADPTDPKNKAKTELSCSKLMWNAVQQFANNVGIKFVKDQPLQYVIKNNALGRGDDSRYQSRESEKKPLENSEILTLYTEMMTSDKLKNSSRKFISAERQFVNKKMDYILHGLDFFQDKTHMKAFAKVYPKVFDYFFQNGIGMKDLNREMARVEKGMIVAELQKMRTNHGDMLSLLGKTIPGITNEKIRIENLANIGPRGISVTTEIYDNKTLMQKWESVKEAANAVIAKSPNSNEAKIANEFMKQCYNVIVSDESNKDKVTKEKINKIDALIAETMNRIDKKSLFASKLNISLKKPDKKLSLVETTLSPLHKALNRRKSFFPWVRAPLNETQRDIIKLLVGYLETLKGTHDNDIATIKHAVQMALRANNVIAGMTSVKLSRKNELDHECRQCLVNINNYNSPTKADNAKKTSPDPKALENFKNTLEDMVQLHHQDYQRIKTAAEKAENLQTNTQSPSHPRSL